MRFQAGKMIATQTQKYRGMCLHKLAKQRQDKHSSTEGGVCGPLCQFYNVISWTSCLLLNLQNLVFYLPLCLIRSFSVRQMVKHLHKFQGSDIMQSYSSFFVKYLSLFQFCGIVLAFSSLWNNFCFFNFVEYFFFFNFVEYFLLFQFCRILFAYQ